jgi:hypothetical protein
MKQKVARKPKFRRNTSAEEARIQEGIAADSNTRELTARGRRRLMRIGRRCGSGALSSSRALNSHVIPLVIGCQRHAQWCQHA